MKLSILMFFIFLLSVQSSFGGSSSAEQEVLNISKYKWEWMASKNIDNLEKLFHEK